MLAEHSGYVTYSVEGETMSEVFKTKEDVYKLAVITALIVTACFITLYFHVILEYSAVFTHLFYVPIVLASFWWKRKGLVVPLLLAVILIISHILFRSQVTIFDDLFRAFIFITIGLVFALMSERISRTREALVENERTLQSILAGSPIPAFVIDSTHKVTHWNKALEEMSGIKADDVLGTNQHWKAFYDEERPCMADLLIDERSEDVCVWYEGAASCNQSELVDQSYEATDFFPALGNEGKWLRFTAATLRDSRGHLMGVIETLEDITDRMNTAEALKESEQRLKTVLEGSPIPTFVIGRDHKVLYWNKALEEMSGIKAEEVVGTNQHWRAFYDRERPCMGDLLVDGTLDEIPRWYVGKYHKLQLIEEAYDATDFFPALGSGGKWLRFTAAALRNSKGILFGAVETLEDITARKLAEEALKESEMRYMELSITDALTKLFNSRHFYSQLKAEAERANRYKHPLSLLLLDIDDFKDFNDTYGHLEGDEVLMRMGKVIKRCLRATDSGYRYGGEEFTLILPETKGEAAIALAERIREEFETEAFFPRHDEKVHKTVSIGVTEAVAGEDLSSFLRRVDEGMYMAKRQGKNRVFYAHH
jgi:diguanylate cyclase (GGDEF)-like protein